MLVWVAGLSGAIVGLIIDGRHRISSGSSAAVVELKTDPPATMLGRAVFTAARSFLQRTIGGASDRKRAITRFRQRGVDTPKFHGKRGYDQSPPSLLV